MADSKITQLNANSAPALADLLALVDDPSGSPETQKLALGTLFPRARVYNSSNISISSATSTDLTFDSERYDTESIHSTVSNTGRLTVPRAGLYLIGANIEWASNATGARYLAIYLDGTTFIALNHFNPITGTPTRQNISTQYYMTAGQYVTCRVLQNSGGSLNVQASGNYSPEFYIAMIGPSA